MIREQDFVRRGEQCPHACTYELAKICKWRLSSLIRKIEPFNEFVQEQDCAEPMLPDIARSEFAVSGRN